MKFTMATNHLFGTFVSVPRWEKNPSQSRTLVVVSSHLPVRPCSTWCRGIFLYFSLLCTAWFPLFGDESDDTRSSSDFETSRRPESGVSLIVFFLWSSFVFKSGRVGRERSRERKRPKKSILVTFNSVW